LYDFDIAKDAVSLDKMLVIDQYALCQLHDLNELILQAYKDRKTTAVFHGLADYCVKDLSAFYLDIVKDRLYVEKSDGLERRSAQTVCYYIVDTLTKLMAPILSVTAELISDSYQRNKTVSIHLQDFENLAWVTKDLFAQDKGALALFNDSWEVMSDVRSAVLKSLEELRGKGEIKHSLDAAVRLSIGSYKDYAKIEKLFAMIDDRGQSLEQFLKEYFIVSQIKVEDQAGDMPQIVTGIFVQTSKAVGGKCARCWQWEEFGKFDEVKQLCVRCQKAL
jgi:isoleucyl-tRNA synthetase